MDDSHLRSQIAQQLSLVLDPELFVSIVDLGLIYNIHISSKKATVVMTLTTIGCPLFGVLEKEIKERVSSLDSIDEVELELVFDPPWSMQMISPKALAELGME